MSALNYVTICLAQDETIRDMSGRQISVCLVMQSLDAGGAERVCPTILRYLDRSRFAIELLVLGDEKGPLCRSSRRHRPYLLGKRARWAIWHLSDFEVETSRHSLGQSEPSQSTCHVSLVAATNDHRCEGNKRVSKNNQEYRFLQLGTLFRLFYRRRITSFASQTKCVVILWTFFPCQLIRHRSLATQPTQPPFAETGSKSRFPATRTNCGGRHLAFSEELMADCALAQCGDEDIGVEIGMVRNGTSGGLG